MTLGQNIKKYREKLGLSVPELANKMGIGKAGIYKWEADETEPGKESLTALARALDVTVNDLLEENPTQEPKSTDNKEMSTGPDKESLYRNLVESNSEYSIVPKTILNGDYRIMLQSEIEERTKMLWQVIEAKNYAIAQLEKEIAGLRSGQIVITSAPVSVNPQNAQ